MDPSLNPPPRRVLAAYGPVLAGLRWAPLGTRGGFSGASVWRGEDAGGTPLLALKSWPASLSAERLARVHAWMGRAAHLSFIPEVVRTPAGGTFVHEGGRLWDMCRWMPGDPCSHSPPARLRVEKACAAVAALHRSWPPRPTRTPCPAVLNRLRVLDEFRAVPAGLVEFDLGLRPVVARGRELVLRNLDSVEHALRTWAAVPVRIRPCVRDLRADHVLFRGVEVTGVIDYGAMAEDHPAVDLARLLGELVGDDDSLRTAGIDAYRASGGEPEVDHELVRLLDRTGVLCALVGWVRRLCTREEVPVDPLSVTERITGLITRVENSAGT